MTQAVAFHFTSPQFVFESGKVAFHKGGRLKTPDGDLALVDFRDGLVEGVLVEGPIEFDAWLCALKAVRKSDRAAYEVGFLCVSREMTTEQLRAGRVVVDLNLPLVLTFRVEDVAGKPVRGTLVSLCMPNLEGGFATSTNQWGEVVLFGTPGRYYASVREIGNRQLDKPSSVHVDITPHDEGERVFVIRVPGF
jgi:hypothetical protein